MTKARQLWGGTEIFGAALDSFENHFTISTFSHVNIGCEHKLNSTSLIELGLNDIQIKRLLDGLAVDLGKDFRLLDVQSLSPQKLLSFAGGRFSNGVYLWILFENLIRTHNSDCSQGHSEYVDTERSSNTLKDIPLEELHLSARTLNILKREQIPSLFALKEYSREGLLQLRNMGITSVEEIEVLLHRRGLRQEFKRNPPLESQFNSEMPLSELNLSRRTFNALKNSRVTKLGQLMKLSREDILDIRQLGEKSNAEIVAVQNKFEAKHLATNNASISDANGLDNNLTWGKEQLFDEVENMRASYGNLLEIVVNQLSLEAFDYTSRTIISGYMQGDPISLGEILKLLVKSLAETEDESEITLIIKFLFDLVGVVSKYLEISKSCKLSVANREALIEYEEDYPNESVDLLEIDNATSSILGLNPTDNIKLLGARTLFDLSDLLTNYLITDETRWQALDELRKFFDRYRAFPNILGLLIAIGRCSDNKRQEVLDFFQRYLSATGRPFSERDTLIIRLRIEKLTLDQIGASVGLTRERIRQIIKKTSPNADEVIDYLITEKKNSQLVNYEASLNGFIDEYGAVYLSELAILLDMESGQVSQNLPKYFHKFVIDKSVPSDVTSEWSRERVAAAIRKAGTYYFPLKTTDYEYLLEIGEVDGPSVPFIYNRFGSWSAMCIESGVESAPSRRIEYVRSWSEEELISFVQRFILSDGTTGSGNGYDAWREAQPDHVPSGVLIRNQFGKWSVARRIALEGIRLKKGKVLKK